MMPEIIPADTTAEAAWVQIEVFRRMPASKRLELTLGMSTTLREVMAAGVRSRHPEYSEYQVKRAVIRLSLGEELFRKAYPGVDTQV